MTNTININGQTFDLTPEQVDKLTKALGINGKTLSDVAIGDTFKVADVEFIKVAEENGEVIAVTKKVLCNKMFDNDTNNFSKSSLLKYLKNEVLPKIEAAVGVNNVVEFETDLTSLDGLDDYGTMKSKISLPTFDFYRKHVKIFDKYKVNQSWWLSTPDSTPTHGIKSWVRFVYVVGALNYDSCGRSFGVRPVCHFVSSIFVS